MTLYQITMYTCPEEWITGKRSMTPAEAVDAGLLAPSLARPARRGDGGPFAADAPPTPPAAPPAPANAFRGPPVWRRAAARLLSLR